MKIGGNKVDKQRRFRVRKELYPILKDILNKNHVDFNTVVEDEQRYISTNISGMQFRKYVDEALCIEQQGHSSIPVVSYRMLVDGKASIPQVCQILRKDEKLIEDRLFPLKH